MSNSSDKSDLYSQIQAEPEIDLGQFISFVWAAKWLLFSVTSLAALASILFALSMPNVYTSSSLLAPAEQNGGGLSGLMKQYGGLANIAGVALPGANQSPRSYLGMELMRSRSFIKDFIERRDILRDLMAVQNWDSGSGVLTYDPEIYDVDQNKWIRKVSPPREKEPSDMEAYNAFTDVLSITQDQITGYVTVSISHQSPEVAANWVAWLVEDVNNNMRKQDVTEAEISIKYLKRQIASTELQELQSVFFDLIQSQTETAMLAEVRTEYVFKVIDPPVAPELKSAPNRTNFVIIGILTGLIFGIVLALGRKYVVSDN